MFMLAGLPDPAGGAYITPPDPLAAVRRYIYTLLAYGMVLKIASGVLESPGIFCN